MGLPEGGRQQKRYNTNTTIIKVKPTISKHPLEEACGTNVFEGMSASGRVKIRANESLRHTAQPGWSLQVNIITEQPMG